MKLVVACFLLSLAWGSTTTRQPGALQWNQWAVIVQQETIKKKCQVLGGKFKRDVCMAPAADQVKCKKIKDPESCKQAGCTLKEKRKKKKMKCVGSANFYVDTNRQVGKQGDVWFGGPIVTMETAMETIEDGCVVVIDKKITAVIHARADCLSGFYAGSGWEWHNLNGKCLMPGFIDPHLHPGLAAVVLTNTILAVYDWEVPTGPGGSIEVRTGAKTEAEYDSKLQVELDKYVFNPDEPQMFKTWGYHQLWHGKMTRAKLNQMAPDFPASVIHRSFHEIFLNDKAIELLNIDEALWSNDPQANFEEGHCWEDCWIGFAARDEVAAQLFSEESYVRGLGYTSTLLIKNGITTVGDPNFPMATADADIYLLDQEMKKDLPYRIYMVPSAKAYKLSEGSDEAALAEIETLGRLDKPENRYWIAKKQVKVFADGAIYSQAMQMVDGYENDSHGEWMTPLDELTKQLQVYWDAGYKIAVHCNGDLGAEEVINRVANMREKYDFDHQFTLHHMGYFTAEQAKRMGELGMEASTNPYYLWALADRYAEQGLGEERAHNLVAMGHLIDNKVPTSFHSDFSMAPAEPLTLAWVAANRITSEGNAVSQDQRLSVWDSLKGITISAARTLSLENEIGSIKAGKMADFTIIDQNPLTFDKLRWNEIKVDHTVFEGRTEFSLD